MSNIAAFFIFIYPKTYAKFSAESVIRISEPLLVRRKKSWRSPPSHQPQLLVPIDISYFNTCISTIIYGLYKSYLIILSSRNISWIFLESCTGARASKQWKFTILIEPGFHQGGKPGLKSEKIDFSIMSQVIILLNLCRITTLYLKSIHKKLHFSTSLAPIFWFVSL